MSARIPHGQWSRFRHPLPENICCAMLDAGCDWWQTVPRPSMRSDRRTQNTRIVKSDKKLNATSTFIPPQPTTRLESISTCSHQSSLYRESVDGPPT